MIGPSRCPLCGTVVEVATRGRLRFHILRCHSDLGDRERSLLFDQMKRAGGWPIGREFHTPPRKTALSRGPEPSQPGGGAAPSRQNPADNGTRGLPGSPRRSGGDPGRYWPAELGRDGRAMNST